MSSLMFLSAAMWMGLAFYLDSFAAAAVFGAAHVLAFRIHIVEVKVNKLLDHNGVFVSNQDIEEQ